MKIDKLIIVIALVVVSFLAGFLVKPSEIKQVTETVVDRVSYDKLNELETELNLARLKVIDYNQQLEGYKDICNIDIVNP